MGDERRAALESVRLDRRGLLVRSVAGMAIPAALVATGLPVGIAAAQSNGVGDVTPAGEGEEMGETTPRSGYAPVNGLRMYYEIHGQGEPLVLLHGAFGTIDLWGSILESLAASRQVIAVELQGHGHTADIDRPLTYAQFVEDTAALTRHLGIEQTDVVGYSLGGSRPLVSPSSTPASSGNSRWSAPITTTRATTRRVSPPSKR